MSESTGNPILSLDAAIVLALADTAVPYACSIEDEAERWVRVLRLHGQVGRALQALGVGEAPLETTAQPRAVRLLRRRPSGENVVEIIADRARELARFRGAEVIATIDVLFAALDVYDRALDRALYVRGTTREELIERLAAQAAATS